MDSAAPRLLPRESRGDRTRARLTDAALAEFTAAGVDGASVSRIAERAGVSRSLFYFHFPTKEHVLLELQRSLEVPLADRIAHASGLRDALEVFLAGLMESQDSVGNPEVFADMLRIYTKRPGELPWQEQPFPLIRALGQQFADGEGSGELRAGLDAVQATQLCLTSVFGYLIATRNPPEQRRADLGVLTCLYLREGPLS